MELFTFENAMAFLTLTLLEIVLGIDNIVFISIIVAKLEKSKQALARRLGLLMAMGARLILLLFLSSIMKLTEPLFSVLSHAVSGRDLILLGGGLFLIGKATYEIHDKLEAHEHGPTKQALSFASALVQIILLDIVFSLDSVITAIGMADNIKIMVAAIVVAVICMLIFAKSVSDFVERHPTFKMLALSFLLLIGVVLVAEGLGQHISKGYIYFAMGFSLVVEILNMKIRGSRTADAAAATAH